MSTSKTKAYKLHKWEGEDNVSRVEFNENFENVDKKLKDIDDRSNDLYDRTNSIKEQISNHNKDYESLKIKVDENKEYFEQIKIDQIENIKAEINNNKVKISNNEEKIKKIDQIENKVKVSNQIITENKNKLKTAESNINRIYREIEGKEKSIKNLNTDIGELRGNIDTNRKLASQIKGDIREINKDIQNTDSRLINMDNRLKKFEYITDSKIIQYDYNKDGKDILLIKRNSNVLYIEPYSVVEQSEQPKTTNLVLTNIKGSLSIRMEKVMSDGWMVTGPYIYNNENFYGTWYSKSAKTIIGTDKDGVIRGARLNGNQVQGLFGFGNASKLNLVEAYVDFSNKNKLKLRYINDFGEFSSRIKVAGVAK